MVNCFHHLIEAQARQTPQVVAVSCGGQQLTYEALDARAERLASSLRARGVGRDVLVGVCVNRSLDMLVGLLGVLKAGGAYVPMDPAFPKDRLAYMLEDSAAPLILTQAALAAELPAHPAEVLLLDGGWDSERQPASAPAAVGPEDLAYVIYTSGSTGKPKGVQVRHAAVVNFLESMRREPGLTPRDVVPALTTLSFDIAALELFLPLVVGARVEIVDRQTASNGEALAALLERSAATVVQATPATWRMLLNAGWKGAKGLKMLCGGEGLPRALADQLLDKGGELWNVYGPTETTIWSTCCRVEGRDGPVSIGRPIANTQVYVLGPDMRPVPPGEAGELVIGGDGLALGYRNRPELTAEKFVPDAFGGQPGRRLYCTGDLARFLPDGALECLGRIDHQVKVRGYRIELGEIEVVLAQHPAVREAVVVAREDEPGDKRLVAYVIPHPGHSVTTPQMRRHLEGKLPEYMVPAAFVELTRFPLTPNGKVNRLALPTPGQRPALDTEYVAPRDVVETDLAACWEEVLGLRPIGVHDNAFDVGIDSLRAARLLVAVEKRTGRKLPPGSLFQAPTVARLANLVRDGQQSHWSSLVAIQPDGTQPPFFGVHGGAGTIFPYHDLARLLGPDQPFYGLQARGLYGDTWPHRYVAEMAAHYLDELRTVQPHGPYYLGGYCFGGIVAFEMAQRLVRQGEEVALLALFNAPSPTWIRERNRINDLPKPRAQANGAAPVGVPAPRPQGPLGRFARRVRRGLGWRYRGLRARWNELALDLRYQFYVRLGRPIPEPDRDWFFRINSNWAEVRYHPRVFPGRLVLFRAREYWSVPPDPLLGWGGLAAEGVEAYAVSGPHIDQRSLLHEPCVREVAERLKGCLARARERGRSHSAATPAACSFIT
jgi:amino acid adenylation domain-containing protein